MVVLEAAEVPFVASAFPDEPELERAAESLDTFPADCVDALRVALSFFPASFISAKELPTS